MRQLQYVIRIVVFGCVALHPSGGTGIVLGVLAGSAIGAAGAAGAAIYARFKKSTGDDEAI